MTEPLDAGVLLVDKPAGITSFGIVQVLRRLLGIKKVGHAGTLDPFATGLLIVCVGRPATKLIPSFMEGEKEYVATLELGKVSSTQDPEGEISVQDKKVHYSSDEVERVLGKFTGKIMQVPPSFSALKHKGKPLYHYARQGITVKKDAREVTIHQLDWLDKRDVLAPDEPSLTIRVRCSKGTYIRSLGADIGRSLGCGAYLTSLRRTKSGFFSVDESLTDTDLRSERGPDLVQQSMLSVEHVRKLLQKNEGMDKVLCSN